jgi:hypothetical protein
MRYFFLFAAFFVSGLCYAQDFLDEIAEQSCNCISENELSEDAEQRTLQLGLCIIESATPFRKKLLKEYKIDMDKVDTQGEELGRLVAMRMLSFCPDILAALASDEIGNTELVETGVVTKIDESAFISFYVKSNSGKTIRFFWLTFIENDLDLEINYRDLLNKNIEVTYSVMELFDPRIQEYSNFNLITRIQLTE